MPTVFKIKNGYCHLLPQQIALLKLEVLPEGADLPKGKMPLSPVLIVISFLGLILIGLGFYGYFRDMIFEAGFLIVLGFAVFYYAYRHIILSRVSVIDRDRIIEISFRHGVPGQTASRFSIFFKDERNRVQERRITLTNRENYADENARKGIALMRQHFQIKE